MTAEVYTSFVDTFFSPIRGPLSSAPACRRVVVGAAWLDTGHTDLPRFLCSPCWSTALARLRQAEAYHSDDEQNVAHHRPRQPVSAGRRCGKTATSGWQRRPRSQIGLYAFIALQIAPSEYSIISSMIIVFGTLPTVVGRVYGSDRLASVIVISLLFPPTAFGTVILRGDAAHVADCIPAACRICCWCARWCTTCVRRFSTRSRDGGRTRKSPTRFDIALNNMSHGLIMFDGDLRVLVANRTAKSAVRRSFAYQSGRAQLRGDPALRAGNARFFRRGRWTS